MDKRLEIQFPKLVDVECSLMDLREATSEKKMVFDFTNMISYYNVTFFVFDDNRILYSMKTWMGKNLRQLWS